MNETTKRSTKKLKTAGSISIITGIVLLFLALLDLIHFDLLKDISIILIVGGIIFLDPFYFIFRKLNK